VKHRIEYLILDDSQLAQWESLYTSKKGKLSEYASQLLWWNKKINLVSRDVSHETILEHIKHSLVLGVIESVKKADTIIDTGSGGGLPGIPLAICFPEKEVILNDIVSKKMMAVKQMAQKMKLPNVTTISGSIANQRVDQNTLVITKHAFKVDELVSHLSEKEWETVLFLKGASEAEEEIKRLDIPVSSNIIELDAGLEDPFYKGKAIVEIRRIP